MNASTVHLTNVTFHSNAATNTGGGLRNRTSNLWIANSIFWQNSANFSGDEIANFAPGTTDIEHSLIRNSGGSGPGWDTNLGNDNGDNIDADPLYVDAANGNLRKLKRPQNEEQVAQWGVQLCDALEAAHRQDVVHRDIKPENILLNSEDEVRLTDFGIAIELDVLRRQLESEPKAGMPGTVEFFAPELWDPSMVGLSQPMASRQTDLYAVGVVLYELATGGHPYDLGHRGATRPRP